ncbi:hypothetical protein Gasu2_48700 [Galdieria sulphuraria]|uniref:Uncharacterized protein n=1 Tax=Galdieria sulphuraria TaxID=130081 RepID=M2XYT4_GALSU|nr:uncharacterized protein Gasu_38820 [Galdieria sulphuraria]EME28674.1 hypothetical protein Gasu_38820 [Galdieria sulphuraria]GJD10693.1 hypothetical protein Gasu2_48700 [Galdieria sulphuraria]|eukprot:XP_005705194.1 hypothetical protein Gasu_38820 [Galdieria sulphuraria]
MEQSSPRLCNSELPQGEETASSSRESSQKSTTWTTQEQIEQSNYESLKKSEDYSETQSESIEPSYEDRGEDNEDVLGGALSAFTKTGAKPKWLKCKLCNYECWPPNARHHLLKCPVLKKSPHLRDKMLPNPAPPPPPPSSRKVYAREEDNPYYFTRINTAPGYICNNCGLGLRGAHRPRHLRSCWKRGKRERLSQNTLSRYHQRGQSKSGTTDSSTCSSRGIHEEPSFFPVMETHTGIWGFQDRIPATCVVHHSTEQSKMKTISTHIAIVSVGEQWVMRAQKDQLSVHNLCS